MMQGLEVIFTNPMVAFIILVGVVVFVHELGHFVAGRLLGVDVEEFSLGFGPRAFGFKRGMTDYRICWLPLGGYVRFYGAEIGGEVPLEKRERAITTAKLYKRAIISAAGPAANFLLSLALMIFLSNFGLPQPAAVVSIIPGSVAEQSGLLDGDRILKIGDVTVQTWQDLNRVVSQNAGNSLAFLLDRDGQTKQVNVTPASDQTQSPYGEQVKVGRIGVSQFLSMPRLVVAQGSALAAAGFRTGDLVTAVGGTPVKYKHSFQRAVASALGGTTDAAISGHISALDVTAGDSKVQSLDDASSVLAVSVQRLEFTSIDDFSEKLKNSSFHSKTLTLELNPRSPAMRQWAQGVGVSLPSLEGSPQIVSRAELPSVVSTDLTLSGFEAIKRGDKRMASLQAWKNCGLEAGDSLAFIEGLGPLFTPTQLLIWHEKLQEKLTQAAQGPAGSSVRVSLAAVGLTGGIKNLACEIPTREGKDGLNRPQTFVDFPVQFLTRGVPVERIVVRSASFVASLGDGFKASSEQAGAIFLGLKKLFTGSVSMGNLGGPIAIARVAGEAAEAGFVAFIFTISLVSINIGMFNLLPLPVLDGGTLMMQGVEAAYGKPLPVKVQQMVQRFGIMIILGLIVLVFYNDILRLFHT